MTEHNLNITPPSPSYGRGEIGVARTIMGASRSPYELWLVSALCLTFGIVNFEMNGINFLTPFLSTNLGLTNTQTGLILAGFWITFSASSYVMGSFASHSQRLKSVLTVNLLAFAICSVFSGLSGSFAQLLACRLLMGALCGSLLPLIQTIVAWESPPQRRGINMGIVQNLGSGVLASFLAPLLLVALAIHYGWRSGFFVVLGPALICTVIAVVFIRNPTPIKADGPIMERPNDQAQSASIFRVRNIWLCAASASLAFAHVTIGAGFLPLYFTQVRHVEPQFMGLLMSVLGVSAMSLGIFLPFLSDKVGRKPVAIAATLAGVLCPLSVILMLHSVPALVVLTFLGWAPAGVGVLLFATIPAESVPAHATSNAIGLVLSTTTLIGGVGGPALAGWSADTWGLAAPLIIEGCCAAGACLIALFLRETAGKRSSLA